MSIAAQAELERLNAMGLLPELLRDRTTGKAIIWGTDTYSRSLGPGYGCLDSISPELLLREPFRLTCRAEKSRSERSRRVKTHAEVFTPLPIVRRMNDYAEMVWFGREDVFGPGRVVFPEGKGWKDYVSSCRLEITCGEAAFLVTRYDTATGEDIPRAERVGFLDRKLRIVNENATEDSEWLEWVFRSFESVYGYEFQGDSLLVARLNMVLDFEEEIRERFAREPSQEEYGRLLEIVSWNVWQMDGLKYTIPYHQLEDQFMLDLGGETQRAMKPCEIFDWREGHSVEFRSLRKSPA